MKFILKAKPPNNFHKAKKDNVKPVELREDKDEEVLDEENIQWEDVDVKEFETKKLNFQAIPESLIDSEFKKKETETEEPQDEEKLENQTHESDLRPEDNINKIFELESNKFTSETLSKEYEALPTTAINSINKLFSAEDLIKPGSFDRSLEKSKDEKNTGTQTKNFENEKKNSSHKMDSLFEKDFTSMFITSNKEQKKEPVETKFNERHNNKILDEIFKTKSNYDDKDRIVNITNEEKSYNINKFNPNYNDIDDDEFVQFYRNSERENAFSKKEFTSEFNKNFECNMNQNHIPNRNIYNNPNFENMHIPQIPFPANNMNFHSVPHNIRPPNLSPFNMPHPMNPQMQNFHNIQNISRQPKINPNFNRNNMNPLNYGQVNSENLLRTQMNYNPQMEEEQAMTNILENPNNIVQKNLTKRCWFLMSDKNKIRGNFNSIELLKFLEEKIKSNYNFENLFITDHDTDIYFTPANLYEVLKENIPRIIENMKNKNVVKNGPVIIPGMQKINHPNLNNMIPPNMISPQMVPNMPMRPDNFAPISPYLTNYDKRVNYNNRNFEPPQMMNINLQVVKNNINFNNITVSGQENQPTFDINSIPPNKNNRNVNKKKPNNNYNSVQNYDNDDDMKVNLGMYMDKNSAVIPKKKR